MKGAAISVLHRLVCSSCTITLPLSHSFSKPEIKLHSCSADFHCFSFAKVHPFRRDYWFLFCWTPSSFFDHSQNGRISESSSSQTLDESLNQPNCLARKVRTCKRSDSIVCIVNNRRRFWLWLSLRLFMLWCEPVYVND